MYLENVISKRWNLTKYFYRKIVLVFIISEIAYELMDSFICGNLKKYGHEIEERLVKCYRTYQVRLKMLNVRDYYIFIV